MAEPRIEWCVGILTRDDANDGLCGEENIFDDEQQARDFAKQHGRHARLFRRVDHRTQS